MEVILTSIDDAAAEHLYRSPPADACLMSVPVNRATTLGDLRDTLCFDMLFFDAIPDTVTDTMVRAGIDRYFATLDLNAPYDPFLAELAPDAAEYVDHAWFRLAWA